MSKHDHPEVLFIMIEFINFDDLFYFNIEYSYDPTHIEMIETHRKSLEGLFVDKVLKALDVKRSTRMYPPKTNADLRILHEAIHGGSGTDHAKLAMFYYLLLDYDFTTKGESQSGSFEERALLPKGFQILMKGLWHMDHLEFEVGLFDKIMALRLPKIAYFALQTAVQYLTHPSLIPTFPEEILETLIRQSKDGDFALPLAYYYSVQPNLKAPYALESLFSAIALKSVVEAFYFSRLHEDDVRRKMFEMLMSLVLQRPPSERAATCALELVNLPFTAEEEKWFEDYLTGGDIRGLKRARDTMMIRKISTGKFSEALSLDFKGIKLNSGLSWGMVQDSLQEGLGPRVGS